MVWPTYSIGHCKKKFMIIKSSANAAKEVATLQALQARSDAAPDIRKRI